MWFVESGPFKDGGTSIGRGSGVGGNFLEGFQVGSRGGSEPCHHFGMLFVSHSLFRVQ